MQNLQKCQEKLLTCKKNLPLRYDDAKHAFQQACSFSAASPLSLWLRNSRYYQVLTREFVKALAAYLSKRKASYDTTAAKSTGRASAGPIVEVGAGLGTLARALRSYGVDLEATTLSTGVFDERDGIPHGVVLEPQLQTIKRLKPSIVLCAWMPDREDWTKRWREATSVSEYIIIGPRLNPFSVSSGTEATWCVKEQYLGSFLHTEDCPPGWEVHGLPQIFQWLLSADDDDSIQFSTSSILSVRRKENRVS